MNQSPDTNATHTDSHTNPCIAFIQASWHSEIVDECRQSFCQEMETLNSRRSNIQVFDVPGSFEIPLLAKKLALSGHYDIIIASGLIVDGGIYRHDFVANAVIDGMMRIQTDHGIPIISAVLTPHLFHENEEHQAFFKQHFRVKGKEAAQACTQTLSNMKQIDSILKAA